MSLKRIRNLWIVASVLCLICVVLYVIEGMFFKSITNGIMTFFCLINADINHKKLNEYKRFK